MKMTAEHFELLRAGITRLQADYPDCTPEAYAAQGLSGMRYRWDCLRAAHRKGYIPDPFSGLDGLRLYAYLNDDHIDTALRKITGTR